MDAKDQLKEQITKFMKVKFNIFLKNQASTITFPVFAQPEVSIILVLYNKTEYTLQCLETIKAYADVPYEMVIVDNASTDQTSELLGKIQNSAIVRNSENRGFLRGCNQGAAVARGKWLLFLNNDTQITPSMISMLIQTAEKTNNCGAVGGKLIFPDGQLQEAGSMIWNDGSCTGYGRGDDPFKPEFSYVREVDYCSGACFLIKKEMFMAAGMFDEHYEHGYYEETDLCMKLRELGYKVIFQPAAIAIHYEFGSSSASEAITLQNNNKEIFVKRWEDRLNQFYTPAAENIIRAREHRREGKCKILMIDDRIPIPELGCGYPRSFKILQGLTKADFAVTLFPLQVPEKVEPYAYMLQQQGIEVIYPTGNEKLNLPRLLAERNNYYDLVMISRLHNLQEVVHLVKNANPNQKIVYDAEALFSLREIGKQEVIGNPLPQEIINDLIHQEINMMKLADQVLTVSEREKRIIESYGIQKVNLLSHQVDIQPTSKTFDQRQDILFVGSFTPGSPNEDAVYYFTREIYPLVYKELGAKLWLVGTNSLDSVKKLASDRIMVTGTVHDLWNYYNNCRVFVVPTRYASGISLKLLECLAHGVPSVVTPLIADQFGLDENMLLIGDGPQDFADKLIKCYTEKSRWQRLRENGLTYIGKEYSPELFHQMILQLKQLT